MVNDSRFSPETARACNCVGLMWCGRWAWHACYAPSAEHRIVAVSTADLLRGGKCENMKRGRDLPPPLPAFPSYAVSPPNGWYQDYDPAHSVSRT